MKLTDIASAEAWQQLAKGIYDKFRLNGGVIDNEGTVVHPPLGLWANKICPLVKGGNESRSVCASAQKGMSDNAGETKKTVIQRCDIGFTKFVVPVFSDDKFLGTVSGCGVLAEGNEADEFYISKLLNMKEKEIKELAKSVRSVSADDLNKAIKHVEDALKNILSQAR